MVKLSASIMCANYLDLQSELRKLEEAEIDYLHCDVFDGHYVNNLGLSFSLLEQIKDATFIPLEVHLGVQNPEKFIKRLADIGIVSITVHVDACDNVVSTVQMIKDAGVMAAVCLNPPMPVSVIEPVLNEVDMVLLMTVNPGFAGQQFIPEVLPKIRNLRNRLGVLGKKVMIQVDGNINEKTIPDCVRNGADNLVLGTSSIFKGLNSFKEPVRRIRELADRYGHWK